MGRDYGLVDVTSLEEVRQAVRLTVVETIGLALLPVGRWLLEGAGLRAASVFYGLGVLLYLAGLAYLMLASALHGLSGGLRLLRAGPAQRAGALGLCVAGYQTLLFALGVWVTGL